MSASGTEARKALIEGKAASFNPDLNHAVNGVIGVISCIYFSKI